ncbi:hypothetical protein QQS21_011650 [Conoideocrella luteorostrata]|uniref:Uncharacterized protein n=1 Tax=Conoideocrella luteorostrata TaxID=1105319 RepID=A0AAJ0FVP5_9HYPO|nr:hypothetical protein QQS21_011650 [Conoideocrella luteorostrata]
MTTHLGPLAHGVIRDDAKRFFEKSLESIYDVWVDLSREATLQPNEILDDRHLDGAFTTLDQHIASLDPLKARLGAIQLTNLMAVLKTRIKTDRQSGQIVAKKRSDSVAIDAYVRARGQQSDNNARYQAVKQVRMSKRWLDLTRGSPLLAVVHTPKAEQIVSDIRFSNKKLIQLGIKVQEQYPPELAAAADYLAAIGESRPDATKRSAHLAYMRKLLSSNTPDTTRTANAANITNTPNSSNSAKLSEDDLNFDPFIEIEAGSDRSS